MLFRSNFSSSLGAPLFRTSAGTVTTTANGNTPITTLDTAGNTIQVRNGMIFRPTDHLAYAGNVIPSGSFDPVAAALLARYPLPTSAGSANNYTRTATEPDQQDQFDGRIDQGQAGGHPRDQSGDFGFAFDLQTVRSVVFEALGLQQSVSGLMQALARAWFSVDVGHGVWDAWRGSPRCR